MTKPHGDCSGDCVAGLLNTDERVAAHNEFVDALADFQTTGDAHDLALALELVALRTENPSGDVGAPAIVDLCQFVAEHNWPEPEPMHALARALEMFGRAAAFRAREADRITRQARHVTA